MSEEAVNDNSPFIGRSPALENVATPKQRISLVMALFLVGAAFIVDGLQALLEFIGAASTPIPGLDVVVGSSTALAGTFLGVSADVCFLIWLYILGVRYMDKNAVTKMLTIGGMTAITFIPLLDILPELTIGILVLVMQTRFEDSSKSPGTTNKLGALAGVAATIAPETRVAMQAIQLEARRKARAASEQQRLAQSTPEVAEPETLAA